MSEDYDEIASQTPNVSVFWVLVLTFSLVVIVFMIIRAVRMVI